MTTSSELKKVQLALQQIWPHFNLYVAVEDTHRESDIDFELEDD